jgi:UTP--glucose-1-phosphate uridylyltransferase
MTITKAVIAVAGFGTRFLPATKAVPKELLPIVDKPIIQYLVEEIVESGIRDIILVTRAGNQAIADHFDSSRELEVHLEESGKAELLQSVQSIAQMANIAVVRQGRHLPHGNGTPLLAARRYLDEGEPFVYLFGDDLVLSKTPCIKQLIDVHQQHKPDGVIAFQEVPNSEINRYAAATFKPGTKPPEIAALVEKPDPKTVTSNLAQLGRFLLPWRSIEILEEMSHEIQGKRQELYLTYANNQLCQEGRVLAHTIEGQWMTTGDPLRYLKTSVEFALQHETIGREFASYLRSLELQKD